jgi:peptide/nickel transport system substrate-binding protein
MDIKFIVDPNTIAANILAGEADVTLGGRLPIDWAQGIREQSNGRANFGPSAANPMVVYVNDFNPVPAAISKVDFRRALVGALDRQAMEDSLVDGLTAIAHATVLLPSRSEEFKTLEPYAVEYPFDPAYAMARIEAMGYRKGPDGIYRDENGQKMTMEIRTTQGDIQQERSMASVAEYWQRIGLGAEQVQVPSARRGDDEYRTTFPGFDIRRNPHRPDTLRNYFHSASAPFPERGYRGGAIQRYVNPELDTLIDLHDATVSKPDRWQILGQIVHLITDQVVVIGLFYDVDVTVQTSRMKNVLTRADQRGEAWNVHEWDVAN